VAANMTGMRRPLSKTLFLVALAAFIVSSLYFVVSGPSMACFGPNVHDCREQH
jgi:hypothetical protein